MDLLSYEAGHGRRVDIEADPAPAGWETWPGAGKRPVPDPVLQPRVCGGCTARLVCHGALATAAARILADGMLRSATAVTGKPPADLAAASTWGEPAG